jgi:hypothetical protein
MGAWVPRCGSIPSGRQSTLQHMEATPKSTSGATSVVSMLTVAVDQSQQPDTVVHTGKHIGRSEEDGAKSCGNAEEGPTHIRQLVSHVVASLVAQAGLVLENEAQEVCKCVAVPSVTSAGRMVVKRRRIVFVVISDSTFFHCVTVSQGINTKRWDGCVKMPGEESGTPGYRFNACDMLKDHLEPTAGECYGFFVKSLNSMYRTGTKESLQVQLSSCMRSAHTVKVVFNVGQNDCFYTKEHSPIAEPLAQFFVFLRKMHLRMEIVHLEPIPVPAKYIKQCWKSESDPYAASDQYARRNRHLGYCLKTHSDGAIDPGPLELLEDGVHLSYRGCRELARVVRNFFVYDRD